MKRMAAIVLAQAALAFAAAPPLPAPVGADFPTLSAYSDARFRKMLLHVYDVSLWTSAAQWSPQGLFALDIRYARAVSGRDLARRSIEEMRNQGHSDAALLKRWGQAMTRVFPDVEAGDRLVGVNVDGREARFYGARGFLGAIDDPGFARAFFDIWLDERTSEPALRRELLKLPR